jgi:hypothetical protein
MTGPATKTTQHPIHSLLLAAAMLSVASASHAQTDLYSNGSANPATPALATGAVTSSGVPAPDGGVWSEAPHISPTSANAIAGFSTHATGLTGSYRFADDFTVPGPDSWRLQTASFFAYQTDSAPGASPFAAINVRIWRGVPDAPQSVIVFGDTTTDRLASSSDSNIYRVFNTGTVPVQPVTTSRLIRRTDAALDSITLPPGVYWIDWQYVSTDPLLHAFSPPVTLPGSRGPEGANAMQFRPDGDAAWTSVVDPGKPGSAPDVAQDLPFILRGVAVCGADFNSDDTVNSQDFFDFLNAFFVSDPSADFNEDAAVNSQDFFDFLNAFFSCA